MTSTNQNLPPINFELPNRLDVLPTITPHQVALCFLIKGYLSPGENDPGGSWPQRQALGDALLTAVREADSVREPTIRELAGRLHVSGSPPAISFLKNDFPLSFWGRISSV